MRDLRSVGQKLMLPGKGFPLLVLSRFSVKRAEPEVYHLFRCIWLGPFRSPFSASCGFSLFWATRPCTTRSGRTLFVAGLDMFKT